MQKLYRLFQLYYRLTFDPDSYFLHYGFLKSIKTDRPFDKKGNPLPWMNYAILDFFEEKLNKNLSLFEYGLGFSTLYFSERLKSVKSVEHDKTWFSDIQNSLAGKDNVSIQLVELDNGYEKAINTMKDKYDIILIDGRKRVECAKNAFNQLSTNGVLILDDSQRDRYREVFSFYEEKGFRKLTFTGLKPSGFRRYASTIFYRAGNNCLDI
ncbi:FkbM family methyltransferase [Ekhidna sp.]|uniref:FkbM family methyltransferase n=1 Tax=Ekhidna sp. TaxID=2608089 RepID=UPI003B5956D5